MKIILTGASGFVATEVLRQTLSNPEITELIAVSRTPVAAPDNLYPGAQVSKLKSVVVDDYLEYSDSIKKEFAGAAACIWTVAITPSQSSKHDFGYVKQVCQESTIASIRAMYEAGVAKPFRFLYVSGLVAERDQNAKPWGPPELGPYVHMRGETENQVLAFAAEHPSEVEACAAKPGMIGSPEPHRGRVLDAHAKQTALNVPRIPLAEMAAACIDQVLHGFVKDPILNDDLIEIAHNVMPAYVVEGQ